MDSQIDRLRALLRGIGATNRVQHARLAAAGVDDSIASLEEFCARLPFTTKAELVADQEANPPVPTLAINRPHQGVLNDRQIAPETEIACGILNARQVPLEQHKALALRPTHSLQ